MYRAIFVFSLYCFCGTALFAQVRPRITRPVNESSIVRLARTTHPLANPANDAGRAAGDLPMERMLLLLSRSPEQDATLERLLADQQDPASPRYRQWLTPEEFGRQFGASQQDLDAISEWLRSRGFRIDHIANGRATIEFSGSARQVENAFHTEMRRYVVNGRSRIANAVDTAIPDALAPVVRGVVSLNSFPRRALHHTVQQNVGGGGHVMVPYDFAAIYNLTPLWDHGFDGTGQTIAIAGRTNIKAADVASFRAAVGLPADHTQIIVNGIDPGILPGDDELEADLDVEWSGAVAKGANVKFVVSKSTSTTDGVDLSVHYIVDNNAGSVMSVSFGTCEADNGPVGNQLFNQLWSQAAAQGMSVFVSSGDQGSAGCNNTAPADRGFAVNGLASTPFNVAVGGTQFNDTATPSTWWNFGNDTNLASAKGYIPEVVWNEASYKGPIAMDNGLWASSGGVSTVYATPSWQSGNGVPSSDPAASGQHHRYLPDVSLAGATHDGYQVYKEGLFYTVGGTSAGSPAMAGIMALVNQYTGGRNGNPNPRLYALASGAPFVYHDVTSGNNAVPCSGGSPNCTANPPSINIGLTTGYNAGVGFDLATGWGSIDANALATNWALPGTATHLSVTAPASAASGTPFNITVTALDPANNTASLYSGTVHFTSTDGAAILPADATLTAGQATFSVTLKTAGNRTITATDKANPSIAGTSSAIAVGGTADLVITTLTAGANASPGGLLTVSVTVANQGSANAGPFVAAFYFSPPPATLPPTVDARASCPFQGLAAGASSTCSMDIVVPLTLPAGTWYLGANADATGAVTESNEGNNSRLADSGATTVTARTPSAVSVSPGFGSANSSFTFTFSDPDGRQDLDVVNILINNFLDARAACYLAYSRPLNVLYLVANDGATLLPGLTLNGQGSASNSQCSVSGAGSSAGGTGNTLTLTLNLSFTTSFAGNKVVYLSARDALQNNSGWQALGAWNVPGANTFPSVTGLDPARGSGSSQTFTFTFADTRGFQDLGVVNVLVNNFLDGRQGCYLAYSRPQNVLYLVNDASSALLPGMVVNGAGSLSNSQCTVTGAGSSAIGNGNTLTLTLKMSFAPAFGGNRVIYMAARDGTDTNNSGWQALGSWTVQ